MRSTRVRGWIAALVWLAVPGFVAPATAGVDGLPAEGRPHLPTGPGLHSVHSGPDRILLRGYAPKGYTRIVELSPPLTAAAYENAPVVYRLPVHDRFAVEIPRFDRGRDRLYSGFLAFNRSGTGSLRPLGQVRYVDFVRGISRFTNGLPRAGSKKGLWVDRPAEALALGLKHAALELDLGRLLCPRAGDGCVEYRSEGLVCRFRQDQLEALDARIRTLSDAGVLVTVVLLNRPTGDATLDGVLQPVPTGGRAGMLRNPFNTKTAEGVQHFVACMEFLVARYADPDGRHGRIAHYVLGEPINGAAATGPSAGGDFAAEVMDYCRTARLAWLAARKQSSNARVFIALDGAWAEPGAAGSKRILEQWQRVTMASGDFGWHVALTPRLDDPRDLRVWDDPEATLDSNTPRVSFRNLEVLTRFLRQPEFMPLGRPRMALIFGSGFPAPEGPEGEARQAAAFGYAYRKAESLSGITALILARQDDPASADHARTGLWARDAANPANVGLPRKLADVFRAADAPDGERVFRDLLSVAGLRSWEEADWPRTVNEGAARLLLWMGADETERLRRTAKEDLGRFRPGPDADLRARFGLAQGNAALLADARQQDPDVVASMIVDAAWQKLQADTPRRTRWKNFR